MSTKIENKDLPAFPISEEETDRIDAGVTIYTGLSKREYFVAMAMQGLCASNMPTNQIPVNCISIADEVLNLLNNTQNPTS